MNRKNSADAIFGSAAMAFFFAWTVGRLADARSGLAHRLSSLKVLVAIGTISYGLYVIHNFTRLMWPLVVERVPSAVVIPPALGFTALSFLLAIASWYLFEKPILKLKDRLAPR